MVTIYLLLYAIQFWLYSTFTHVTSIGQVYRSLIGSFGRSLSRQIARADKLVCFVIVYLSIYLLVSQVFILVCARAFHRAVDKNLHLEGSRACAYSYKSFSFSITY